MADDITTAHRAARAIARDRAMAEVVHVAATGDRTLAVYQP